MRTEFDLNMTKRLRGNYNDLENNLDILEMAYLTRSITIDPDILSWVPDWRKVPLS